MPTKYEVRCEDGARRHVALFSTHGDATTFAYWGHCCTAKHNIVPVDVEPTTGLAVLALCFTETLDWVYDEWHSLIDMEPGDIAVPPCAHSRERFNGEMARMMQDSFLHPQFVHDARVFGNHWTI